MSRRNFVPWLAVPTLAITAFTGVLPAEAVPAPVPGPNGGPGTYTEQNIGAELFGDSSNYRIPALADLGDSVVIAAWDGRPFNAADSPNPNSIVMRRSTDYGKTWSDIYYIAQGQLGKPGIEKYGYSDPSFVVDRQTGKVFAFFVYSQDQGFHGSEYGNDTANDRNIIGAVVVESSDGGLTWSEPRDITQVAKPGNDKTNPAPGDVRSTFATSGEGIQLQYGEYAGRLIQQYAGWVRQPDGSEALQAYSVYSDDHGLTWQRGAFVGTGMDENKVVELSDGRLLLNSRDSTNSHYRKVAISEDGGQTWGPVTLDTELPDPTNNASIFRMFPDAPEGSSDAQKLLFTNSNNGANGDRINLSVRLSCDNGETWPGLRQFKPGFGAYSTGTALSNGMFGVLYEASYTNDMRFGTFDEDWLNAVCAPLSADPVTVTAGETVDVPVTITNQEQKAITGRITLADSASFTGTESESLTVQPGESRTVTVRLSAATSARSGTVDAVFTENSGKQSRHTIPVTVEGTTSVFGATIHDAGATTRDVTTQPYVEGEKIRYTFSVTNTSDEMVAVVPTAGNFDTGFMPPNAPNCRYSRLAAGTSYTCTTAEHTVTTEDVQRGYFVPSMTFSVTSVAQSERTTTITHTGTPVKLRDVDLTPALSIDGAATSEAQETYAEGDTLSYRFTVTNNSPFTVTSTPTAGNLENGFFTSGTPNCRYRNLAANTPYTCTTATHTVTAEDLQRGYFEPTATFTATSSLDGSEKEYTFTGERIPLPSAAAEPAPAEDPTPVALTDVTAQHPNYKAIQWSVRSGVLPAFADGTFQPRANLSRGELAAALFRMYGSDDYQAPTTSPLKDVPTSHKFYRELSWAHENGVLLASAKDATLRPDAHVTREELAGALFKAETPEGYEAPIRSPWKDVASNHASYRSIAWLAELSGKSGENFRPNAPVKREDAAFFLYPLAD